MRIRVIITGATGMVGEGAMHTCLEHPDVEAVLVINRRSTGVTHPKLKEIIHNDFFNFSSIEDQLSGYNACFFCLGVSSVGMKKEEYYRLTYTLTMHVAETLSRLNPQMTFCYISGAGTNINSRLAWARVKGKTEADIMKLPFKQAYALRPGFIKPIKGLIRTNRYYKYIMWMFPIGRALSPSTFCTLKELSLTMINLVRNGYEKNILEGNDIIKLGAS
ncbi:MAG: NAD-dependent epimerase/dehydratase family protein [Chitinophagaceae bacterium]|nr:NAD-dependent epimerase/dehydratase family protein [Chitinophagaceae bacterium]